MKSVDKSVGARKTIRRILILSVPSALSFFLLACLLTYSVNDPGWSISNSNAEISNIGGVVGAYIADVGHWAFGYSAFLVPFVILLYCWRTGLTWREEAEASAAQPIFFFIGFLLVISAASGMEHMLLIETAALTPHPAGGILGHIVATSLLEVTPYQLLVPAFLTSIFLGLYILQIRFWVKLIDRTGELVWSRKSRLTEKHSEPEISVQPDTTQVSVVERTTEPKASQLKSLKNRLIELVPRFPRKTTKESKAHRPRVEPIVVTSSPAQSIDETADDGTEIYQSNGAGGQSDVQSQNASSSDTGNKRRSKQRRGRLTPPKLSFLDPPEKSDSAYSAEDIATMSRLVEQKLAEFNVQVKVKQAHPGPIITQLEVEPAPGVKASQIVNLARDLARSLAVSSVRVVDNIPGSPYVGLEVPNRKRELVRLVDGVRSATYRNTTDGLPLVLGKNIRGNTVVANLTKMPHLLIAGTTGAGKSVCLNAILLSLLYKNSPDDVRLIMIDPKMLEFSVYEGVPHLLTPVITDMKETENALNWCIKEMELRFQVMVEMGVRNLTNLNEKIASLEAPIANPLYDDPETAPILTPLPYLVVIIDELADLIMVLGRKAEELIIRIAQRARAAGIHLIVATQRPSVDVIRGVLKANIPSRVAFKVASSADSRTILDQTGAEMLLGNGDMLFVPPDGGSLLRVHGSFVSDDEVKRVVDHLTKFGAPEYDDSVIEDNSSSGGFNGEMNEDDADELYERAVELVTHSRRATISSIQRHLRIGYNRAANLMETMERCGIVSELNMSGKREVLVPPPQAD